ncbi:FAD-dependent oxidoreductase [Rhodoplanes roseus]|nr:FAD-dependent oxidoreductase [Rhodoplanes roseus]
MLPDRVGIVGAGPAGLTAAYALARRGVAVEVFDALDAVGGMARSLTLWGQTVDLGPHRFFSTDPRVNALWLEAVDGRYDMVDRLTRIYYRGTFFDYPLKPGNALRGLGLAEAARCVLSYGRAAVAPRRDETSFEGWVVNRFGRRLFEIFFQSYSEKLWGIPCDRLDADFAAQRIRKLSLFEAVKAALAGGGETHKTLVDRFAYPHGGAGQVYEQMAEAVRRLGGHIHLGRKVARIDLAGRPVIELEGGDRRSFCHVVSSMPITRLVETLDPPDEVRASARRLTFRNTILVYLEVDGADLFQDQWVYVHEPALRTGRITNFRNWLPSLCGDSPNSILCLEYWCDDRDALWTTPSETLSALAADELRRTGLVGDRAVRNAHVVRLARSYPVYARGYKAEVATLSAWLSRFETLSVVGRYGAFKYNNQDHSILMGLLAAENICGLARHDLWAVNADDEYQEASVITATGLEKR